MMKRVLIIGGYGNFGSYIAKKLAENINIQLIIAGRDLTRATQFCSSLEAINPPIPRQLDIHIDLGDAFDDIKPDIVIHTSGPFQGQDAFVAEACINYGCHYIDLADARDFVTGISKLDTLAKGKNVLIVSGASSVPCLSSCLIDHYMSKFSELEHVEYAITTAQKTNRGLATTQAVLSYAGEPFDTLIDGRMQPVYGWQDIHRHSFPGVGKKLLGNCDVPDLSLFPARYPALKTLRFYAGLEIPFIHTGLWGLTWLRRLRLLPSLDKLAPSLLKISFLFDRFGSDTSAFYMKLSGKDTDGRSKAIAFDLTARSGDGPYIPCMPAILLASKLANGAVGERGAMACIGFITMEEYLKALEPLDISWSERQS